MLAVLSQNNTDHFDRKPEIGCELFRVQTAPRLTPEMVVSQPKPKPDMSAINRQNVWRTWTYLTQRELGKFKVRKYAKEDGAPELIVRTSRVTDTCSWNIYDRDGSPYIYELVVDMQGMEMKTTMPVFLYPEFVKTFPQYKPTQKTLYHHLLEDLSEELEEDAQEFLENKQTTNWTPATWGADLPLKYWNRDEKINWANNLSFIASARKENITHVYGNIYDVSFYYTYGKHEVGDEPVDGHGDGHGSGNAKRTVRVTTRVDKKTGKIYRVNYNDGDELDGDIDDNNNLKVATNKKSPDDYVYGFKVAKTLDGEPCIVKLMIPKAAKIACRADDWKMRVDWAWVTGIWKIEYDRDTHTVTYGEQVDKVRSFYYKDRVCNNRSNEPEFFYVSGEKCESRGFEPGLDQVCVPGIHFYFSQRVLLDRAAAEFYHWGNGTPNISNAEVVDNEGFSTRAQKMGLI